MKIKSQAQAGYLGAAAAGKVAGGPTPTKARKMLRENRGMKMRNLPERAPAREGGRKSRSRVSSRGGR